MDWRTVIKEKRELNPSRYNRAPQRRKPPVKIAGGKPSPATGRMDEPTSNAIFGQEIDELADMTREDLMDAVMDKIGQMSRKELIEILERTQGDLKEVII